MSERLSRSRASSGAGENHLAAVFAGAGAEIENVIGGEDGVGIVLDDQERVAEIAQAFQDVDEAMRVARMQADGRLIENVERADEMRAERCGQLDALGFAAGESGGEAIERKILEADFDQVAQALLDFFENFRGDAGFGGRELNGLEKFAGFARRSCCRLR